MKVIELRNYLLKQGKRDEFIQYFKDHFVDSQQQMGAYVPALFRIKNEEQRFFWVRGFDSMENRNRFLPSFYGGDVWEKFGPAANDMMLEWHDVHLVKPLHDNVNAFSPNSGFFVIDYYKSKENELNHLIDFFNREYIPFLSEQNVHPITLWTSEMKENDFPRLPVYQDKNLLIVVSRFNSEDEYKSVDDQLNFSNRQLAASMNNWIATKSSLSLFPVNM